MRPTYLLVDQLKTSSEHNTPLLAVDNFSTLVFSALICRRFRSVSLCRRFPCRRSSILRRLPPHSAAMVKHNNVVPNRHFHKDWQVRPAPPQDDAAAAAALRWLPPEPRAPPQPTSRAEPRAASSCWPPAPPSGARATGQPLTALSLLCSGPRPDLVRPARQEALPPPQARCQGREELPAPRRWLSSPGCPPADAALQHEAARWQGLHP